MDEKNEARQAALGLKRILVELQCSFNGPQLGFELIALLCVGFVHQMRTEKFALLLQVLDVFSNCLVHGGRPLWNLRDPARRCASLKPDQFLALNAGVPDGRAYRAAARLAWSVPGEEPDPPI
jgi:hypothetical protein